MRQKPDYADRRPSLCEVITSVYKLGFSMNALAGASMLIVALTLQALEEISPMARTSLSRSSMVV
jgi:hypothetical protein